MKKLSKVLAMVLAFVMLMSVSAFAATLTTGTNGNEITLSFKYTSDYEATAELADDTTIAAGSSFFMWLNFAGNPTKAAESIQGYDLLIAYDAEKMNLDHEYVLCEGLATPTNLTPVFADGLCLAAWGNPNGIKNGRYIAAEGTLFGVEIYALSDLTMSDIKAITFATEGVSKNDATKRQVSNMIDGSTATFTVVIPDIETETPFVPETIKGDVVEGEDDIILEKDPANKNFNNKYLGTAVFKATLGATVKYGEAGFIWVKDGEETANKYTVDASVIAGGGTFAYGVAMYGIPEGVDIDAIPYYVTAE